MNYKLDDKGNYIVQVTKTYGAYTVEELGLALGADIQKSADGLSSVKVELDVVGDYTEGYDPLLTVSGWRPATEKEIREIEITAYEQDKVKRLWLAAAADELRAAGYQVTPPDSKPERRMR